MFLVHTNLLIYVRSSLLNPKKCSFSYSSLYSLLAKYKDGLYLYAIYNDTSQH